MKIAQPGSFCANSQTATGIHTSGAPICTSAAKKVSPPSSAQAGTPAIQ